MFRKYKILMFVLTILFPTFIYYEACAVQGKNVPQYIRQLVFEKSNFMQPITLHLPCEDNPNAKTWVIKHWEEGKKFEERYEKYGGLREPFLPPVHISNARQISEPILLFLTQNGFAKVEEITMVQ